MNQHIMTWDCCENPAQAKEGLPCISKGITAAFMPCFDSKNASVSAGMWSGALIESVVEGSTLLIRFAKAYNSDGLALTGSQTGQERSAFPELQQCPEDWARRK